MVRGGDTITSVTTNNTDIGNNVTATALFAWNPCVPLRILNVKLTSASRDLGQTAGGLQACVPICTDVTGYTFTGQPAAGSQLPAAAAPAPIMYGITASCTLFEFVGYVGESVSVGGILADNNITDAQFRAWNKGAIANDGTIQIWAGYYVCVAAT